MQRIFFCLFLIALTCKSDPLLGRSRKCPAVVVWGKEVDFSLQMVRMILCCPGSGRTAFSPEWSEDRDELR